MDSKIILAIFIVALIGIVAATYHNETSNVVNSLASVATEDSNVVESVTDLAEASPLGDGRKTVQVDESIVQPDSSVNSKVVSTPKSSNNNQQSAPSTSSQNTANNPAAQNAANPTTQNVANPTTQDSNTGSSSQQSTTQDSTNTQTSDSSSSQQSTISEAEAMSIAKNSLGEGLTSNYQKVTETTIDGKPYYEVNLYQDGEVIAYTEIDATNGRVTGGATKGEAPAV